MPCKHHGSGRAIHGGQVQYNQVYPATPDPQLIEPRSRCRTGRQHSQHQSAIGHLSQAGRIHLTDPRRAISRRPWLTRVGTMAIGLAQTSKAWPLATRWWRGTPATSA